MPDDRARPLHGPGRVPAGNLTQRSAQPGESSLAEMLSISDWRRFVPEGIGFLLLIWLIRDNVIGGPATPNGTPHPFWIAVLLLSSQYGVMGGLFATSLATAAFFATELPMQSAGQDFYAYAAAISGQPCAWFGIALVIGGLRTLHKHHEAELQTELAQAKQTAADLAEGLATAIAEVGRLEHRIAVDANTLANFSHGLGKLVLSDREALLSSVSDMLEDVVGASSFTIFLDDGAELRAVLNVDEGLRTPLAAAPPIPVSADGSRGLAALGERIRMPHGSPIPSSNGAAPTGFILLSRLRPSQDPAMAAARLADVCQLLALLLPTCRDVMA